MRSWRRCRWGSMGSTASGTTPCGPVEAGVIGTSKFSYDLWGDTVNTASRMESHGVPGCIQVTERTYQRLRDGYRFQRRGPIAVRGMGEMVTYLLVGRNR